MQTVLSLGNALNQGTARGKLILNFLASILNALLLLKKQILGSKIPYHHC